MPIWKRIEDEGPGYIHSLSQSLAILNWRHPSGSTLTFESRMGFPAGWACASLAHANRNFHHPQAR